MSTPTPPTADELAAALQNAAGLFKTKAEKLAQIAQLQADIAVINQEILAQSPTIQPLADSVQAYVVNLQSAPTS